VISHRSELGRYHGETDQEDFLVMMGVCVPSDPRPGAVAPSLDFVDCPRHVILAVEARTARLEKINRRRSELSLDDGASVATGTGRTAVEPCELAPTYDSRSAVGGRQTRVPRRREAVT
jgi:hypothetical protein